MILSKASTVGADGTVYESVGDNIRASAPTVDNIKNNLGENGGAELATALGVDSAEFKKALLAGMSGQKIHFGGLDEVALSAGDGKTINVFLKVDADSLKAAVIAALSGQKITFANGESAALTEENKTAIKTYLGITAPAE